MHSCQERRRVPSSLAGRLLPPGSGRCAEPVSDRDRLSSVGARAPAGGNRDPAVDSPTVALRTYADTLDPLRPDRTDQPRLSASKAPDAVPFMLYGARMIPSPNRIKD